MRALALARESGDAQNLDPALGFAARTLLTAGSAVEAGKLLNELGHSVSELDAVPPSPWQKAAHAFVAGDPGRAASIYAEIGSRPDEAYARLQAARGLIAGGHATEAASELTVARTFYREVGANAYLAEVEALTVTAGSTTCSNTR